MNRCDDSKLTSGRCGIRPGPDQGGDRAQRVRRDFLLQVLGQDGERPEQAERPGRHYACHGTGFCGEIAGKKFHGIGPATAAKMEKLEIETGAYLREKPLAFLQEHFGKAGGWYYAISRGMDDRPVQPDRPRKSVGAEDTFTSDIFDLEAAKAELAPLASKVWQYCEDRGFSGKTVTVKVKYADFQIITRSRTIHGPVRGEDELRELAVGLLEATFPTPKGIRLLGITLSSLMTEVDGNEPQLSFAL